MRIIDLHCYPGTAEWIRCQGPYVEALAKYWKREWVARTEEEVIKDFTDYGIEAVLVALDLETTIETPPVTNESVHAMWKRHPRRIIQAWGAVEPAKGEVALGFEGASVPQLSDEDYKSRPKLREADLRRHLVQQAKIKDEVLEADDTPDPRFLMTAAELEKKGVKDFQLDYALKTLKRLGPQPVNLASKSGR